MTSVLSKESATQYECVEVCIRSEVLLMVL